MNGIPWTRAMEDQSAPIPDDKTSELGGNICKLAGHVHGETIWLAFKGEAWRTVRREKTPGTFSEFIPFLKDFY
jgi:hypothetical protein